MKTNINLHDRKNKTYIMLKPSKKGWIRFESKNKKTWKQTHNNLSLKEALKFKDDVINNNFTHLFKTITKWNRLK